MSQLVNNRDRAWKEQHCGHRPGLRRKSFCLQKPPLLLLVWPVGIITLPQRTKRLQQRSALTASPGFLQMA